MKNLIKTSLVITLLISAPSLFGMAETQKQYEQKQQEAKEKLNDEITLKIQAIEFFQKIMKAQIKHERTNPSDELFIQQAQTLIAESHKLLEKAKPATTTAATHYND